MQGRGDEQVNDSTAEEEAIRWLARRMDKGGLSLEEEEAFRRWLAASPVHAREYEEAEKALGTLARPEHFPEGEVGRVLRDADTRASSWRIVPWMAAAAAVAAVILLGVWFWPPPTVDYRTGFGEQRTVMLEDGSQVFLDAGAHLQCRFGRSGREARLLAGAAVFELAADDRPFALYAADCEIRDIGTTFSVKLRKQVIRRGGLRPAGVEVAVAEGAVELRAAAAGAPVAARVDGGQAALWTGPEQPPEVAEFPAGTFASWREGLLRYRNRPLAEVLADLNRLHGVRIAIEDVRIERLTITGTLPADDLAGALSALQQLLPVRVREGSRNRLVVEQIKKNNH